MQVWHGMQSWQGMLGPSLFYPIMLASIIMSILNLPLFPFSEDSLFVVDWLLLYLAIGAALYVLHQIVFAMRHRSLDLYMRSLLKRVELY
mmetsp:Transcript_3310/g.8168  ORF Transcript_3310/g.8168 Transcript_3310/m.8168 type:complete len:90 (-) Transcript_3310:402-671(-)